MRLRARTLGLVVVSCALLIGARTAPALVTTNDFVGGHSSNSWNDPANWSQGHVPLSTEDVTIATADPTLSSTLGGSDGDANSISVSSGRSLTINAKKLTVGSGASSLAGHVAISNGTLVLNGDTTWSAGASSISMDTSSTLTINSTFGITADDSTNTDAGSLIHVSGTGSVTTSNTGTAAINVKLDNDGSVTVGSGALEVGVGDNGTTAGSYSVAGGATLLLGSGSLDPSTLTGSGTMAVVAGTLTVGSGDTFTPHTVDLRGDGARFTVNKDVSVPTFTTTGSGNSVGRDGTGTLTVTGSASFAAKTTFSGGTTTIADTVPSLSLGGAPLTIDSTASATANSTLTLNTPTTWSGGTNTIVLFGGTTPATLNINSSFAITGDGQIGSAFGTLIHVAGTGSITTSNTGTATIQAPLDNDGTITIGSGTLEADGGLTQAAGLTSVASGATLRASVTLSGGMLNGNGTVDGSVANTSGTVAPGSSPGTLAVTGAYTQGPGGTLAEEITGTTPGTQFDRLLVGGALTLDGTLAIDSTSFTPTPTDTFKVMSGATSRTGTFAALTGATVNGVTYSAEYDPDGVTLLVAGPPPPPNRTLSVTFAGTGGGSVFDGGSLTCSASCEHQYPQGTVVHLSATADAGSMFAGWSGGGCSGTGTCTVTMSVDEAVTATFNAIPPPVTHTLSVSKSGSGSGSVTSNPAGISCGSACSTTFNAGTQVTLTATADSGSTFTGWSGGGCSGTGTCVITLNGDATATATFTANPSPPPRTQCVVPKLKGKKLGAAKIAIRKAHCRVGKVTKVKSTRKHRNRVISQNPKPGKHLRNGSKVALKVGT